MSHTYEYPRAAHTVDAVVFGLSDQVLKILLMRRAKLDQPYPGAWALPGGFIDLEQDLEETARQTLKKKTGVDLSWMEQLYTFGQPDRDPRGRVISTSFLGLVRPSDVRAHATEHASEVTWRPVDDLPDLAFDHTKIVGVGLHRLRTKLRWQPVGLGLLPPTFTLSDLQQLYEVIGGHPLDKRNFRRKVHSLNVLVPTGVKRRQGQHRPAELYRYDETRYQQLLEQGLDFELV